jgi:hypothetical protein
VTPRSQTFTSYEEVEHDDGEYDESCSCEDCVIERGRWLSVLMFGWMLDRG